MAVWEKEAVSNHHADTFYLHSGLYAQIPERLKLLVPLPRDDCSKRRKMPPPYYHKLEYSKKKTINLCMAIL